MSKKYDLPGELDDVNYLIVEMVKASDVRNKSVSNLSKVNMERGLFLGIIVKHETMFIATTSNGADLRLYNVDAYNISMIEYGNSTKKFFVVFTKEVEEQEESVDTIGHILASFQKRDMSAIDDRFLDFEKLKGHGITNTSNTKQDESTEGLGSLKGHIPDYVIDEQEGYGGVIGKINKAHNHGCTHRHWEDDYDDYITGQRSTYISPAKKYEKRFTMFSRKSTKPSKKKLTTMMDMVVMVFENKGKLIIDNTKEDDYNEDNQRTLQNNQGNSRDDAMLRNTIR